MHPEKNRWESYRQHHRAQAKQQEAALQKRQQQGLQLAQHCADILKKNYSATRVVLFGSMLTRIHQDSDIDLAVWNIHHYFAALAELTRLSDFSIDLVPVEDAQAYLLTAIMQGKEL